MSHFPVLVIGDDIEEQLAPYSEQIQTAPRREYLDGEEVERMAAHYRIATTDLPALAAKLEDWCGDGGLDAKGLYRSCTYNPDAKWDWYEIGGRWSGFLKLKDGAEGAYADARWKAAFDDAPEQTPGFADVAAKGDVDFDGMAQAAADEARETWKAYEHAIAGTPPHIPWATFVKRVEAKELSIDDARAAYGVQPRVARFRAEKGINARLGFFASPDDFPSTEEAYVADARASAMTTFAYVINGEWHERGEMGWFGITANETDPRTWADAFRAMLDSLPDDETLTIVDCHI